MKRWQRIRNHVWFRRLTNKFILATLFFIVWMTFADRNSMVLQMELDAERRALENGIEFYQKELENARRQLDEWASDPEKLEKFARETYWMRRNGEHVILVEPLESDDE